MITLRIVPFLMIAVPVLLLIVLRLAYLSRMLRREVRSRAAVEQELALVQHRYRALTENAPSPIVIVDLGSGVIQFANLLAASTFHINREYAVGRPIGDYYVKREDQARLMDTVRRFGHARGFEVQLRTGENRIFWASLAASIITFNDRSSLIVSMVDISDRKEMEERLLTQVVTDELTGLWNRRHFFSVGETTTARARRYGEEFAVLMIDADNFKSINDEFGHAAGDEVLRQIAGALQESFRESDVVARLGGEEFGIILPHTPLVGALALAERFRAVVAAMKVSYGGDTIEVTVSIGVAAIAFQVTLGGSTGDSVATGSFETVLHEADAALYAAKRSGKNRVAASDRSGGTRHD
ncbi:MAG: sensor domain-containing diguanylate cyclase [Spirochaetales bacterium]|nr:sensor domain-containing diguanylate cyclase [Spirochaetales bacterium]